MKAAGILMVTGAYWPELSGGGLQSRTMIKALSPQFRFRVFTTCTDRSLPANEMVDGIPVSRAYVDVRRPWTKVSTAFATLKFFFATHRTFDVVHLHGFSQKSVLLIALARLFRKQVVITIHTAGHDEPEAVRRLGWLPFFCYSSADRFVAISDRTAENYRRSGLPIERLVVAPNGVDTDRFAPVSPAARVQLRRTIVDLPDVPWILFVGFFSIEKGPELLFEAWLRTIDAGTQSALVFVGATASTYHEVDPAMADRIRAEAAARGLGHLVHFAGEVAEIERYYQASDVFVTPSVREAFGMALAEAMACALPVVATRIEGVTDGIVDDGRTGILVTPGDVTAIGDALNRLLMDRTRARELGTAARESVVARFGLAASAARWSRLYMSL